MTEFTVRVELHDADANDYELLYLRMALRGYTKEIRGDSGAVFALPTAEFITTKKLTVDQVRNEVLSIAKGVRLFPAPYVLVTISNGRAWSLKAL